MKLSEKYPFIYQAAATTPHDVEKEGEENFELFAKAARNGQLVAVGETGLDYFYDHSDQKVQRAFLIRYLNLAKETNLPVIIHCREAFEDLFAITDEHYKDLPLLLHCFTGTKDEAKRAIDRGWLISASGIVTFNKSMELQEVFTSLPKEHVVVETDSPYLAPVPHRGQVCEPAFVVETGKFVCDLMGLDHEVGFAQFTQNAEKFFRVGG
ncbi:MAG: putative metal-dependent hydrolase YcfH [Chlamydiia bacterium]|nr:putative metal-dependent hydrolase YcfH [Chlamydiia bacterium]